MTPATNQIKQFGVLDKSDMKRGGLLNNHICENKLPERAGLDIVASLDYPLPASKLYLYVYLKMDMWVNRV